MVKVYSNMIGAAVAFASVAPVAEVVAFQVKMEKNEQSGKSTAHASSVDYSAVKERFLQEVNKIRGMKNFFSEKRDEVKKLHVDMCNKLVNEDMFQKLHVTKSILKAWTKEIPSYYQFMEDNAAEELRKKQLAAEEEVNGFETGLLQAVAANKEWKELHAYLKHSALNYPAAQILEEGFYNQEDELLDNALKSIEKLSSQKKEETLQLKNALDDWNTKGNDLFDKLEKEAEKTKLSLGKWWFKYKRNALLGPVTLLLCRWPTMSMQQNSISISGNNVQVKSKLNNTLKKFEQSEKFLSQKSVNITKDSDDSTEDSDDDSEEKKRRSFWEGVDAIREDIQSGKLTKEQTKKRHGELCATLGIDEQTWRRWIQESPRVLESKMKNAVKSVEGLQNQILGSVAHLPGLSAYFQHYVDNFLAESILEECGCQKDSPCKYCLLQNSFDKQQDELAIAAMDWVTRSNQDERKQLEAQLKKLNSRGVILFNRLEGLGAKAGKTWWLKYKQNALLVPVLKVLITL